MRPRLLLSALEVVLALALAAQAARLVWVIAAPAPPLAPALPAAGPADLSVLTRFDPFFRQDAPSQASAASQTFRLFGVRAGPGGGGSAIIAGPDGRQASVGVGEQVAPGVTLRSVAEDHVVLSRGGVSSRLHFPDSEVVP